MAHIPDGVLATPVLVSGGVVSVILLGVALRRLDYGHLPHAAVLSAALFVSSLISVPLGPSSAHLLLNGLMGLLLGWTAVPAIAIALLLQAVFFGFGGLVVLGVNLANIAVPALLCSMLLAPLLRGAGPRRIFWTGFGAGLLAVMLTGSMVALSLALSQQAFVPAAKVIAAVYGPLALVEALITATILGFLARVAPESIVQHGETHA